MPQCAHDKRQRGIALVIVLWIVMLLAIMAQSFLFEVRTDVQLTRNLLENSQARAEADGAIMRTIAQLSTDRLQPDAVFDGRERLYSVNGIELKVAIQDEAGKIDLNMASDTLLENLFRVAGLDGDSAKSIADKVIDWRDENEFRQLEGAEDSDYRSAGLPYGAKDQPFESVAELKLILGMTEELFDQITPALTVHSKRSSVDLSVAPKLVLLAVLGNDEEGALAVLESRQMDDPLALNKELQNLASAQNVAGRSRRNVFSIELALQMPSGAASKRTAVVEFTRNASKPFRILAWNAGGD